MNKHAKPHAFTLIELVIVIGILGILIAILLPALVRAREASNRAHCLSNLHQIATYLQQYQNQYRGQLPIYFTPGVMDRFIYHGVANDYSNLGLLVAAGIAPKSGSAGGRVFYCPGSTLIGSLRRFNYVHPTDPSVSNPWVGWRGYWTRVGYSQRPEYVVLPGTVENRDIQFANARYDMDRTTADRDEFIDRPIKGRPVFPRVHTLNRKSASALLTDLIDAGHANCRLIHRSGWNVLYANWSARHVPQANFDRRLKQLQVQELAHPNGSPAVRRARFDLWQALDRS